METKRDKEQSLTSGPSLEDEMIANTTRQAPVSHNDRTYIQTFMGIIPPKSKVVLQTTGHVLNIVNINLYRTGSSKLLIIPMDRPDRVPDAVPTEALPEEEETAQEKKRPYKAAAKKALDLAKKADRIQAIARAPMDQRLSMEVFFGDGKWVDNYSSGMVSYEYNVKGAAESAMIKLTNDNPINAAWFIFSVNISLWADSNGE